MIYKYSQLDENNQLSYNESMIACKGKNLHLGQLKLFFTELLFLTMHCQKGDLILYVGGAPGYHTNKLVDLFPDANFELWDPREFQIEPKPNVKTFQDYFTDKSAESYKQSKNGRILFMCDLRNMSIGRFVKTKNIDQMDNLVSEDMVLQKRWCNVINPEMAYLKFRLPYEIPKTKYLTGTIYLQPYTKVSTESRLMTNDYQTEIFYDNLKFEKVMAYHNSYNRCKSKKYDKWDIVMTKYNLKNNWDNALALYITRYYLKHAKNNYSMDDVGKLFMEIVNFHIDEYGRKYDVLFNNISNN